jgi:adenylyl-sulfate kinase
MNQLANNHVPTLWLTGLSGAGKSTLAFALERRLLAMNCACFVLDGDRVRHGLTQDLGFSVEDRSENIRRVAEVAKMMNQAKMIAIAALISPDHADREMARLIVGADHFLEIHVSTSIAVCERRDPKGLYKRARAGEIKDFTGISAPYDAPVAPILSIDSGIISLDESVDLVIGILSLTNSQAGFDKLPSHVVI